MVKFEGNLIQYVSIMVSVLSICYVLIVTNPPSDLQKYENKDGIVTLVTRHLSTQEISTYLWSLSPFLSLFALIMIFNGYLANKILTIRVDKQNEEIFVYAFPFVLTIGLIAALGLILVPYYGNYLAILAFAIGVPAYCTGILMDESIKYRRLIPLLWGAWALFAGMGNIEVWVVGIIFMVGLILSILIELIHRTALHIREK